MTINIKKLSGVAAALAVTACSNGDLSSGTSADVSAGRDDAGRRATADDSDNTGRNVRDREATVTPIDQSNSEIDIALTQKLRRGITSNDEMSLQARNAKVISQQGVVTLRGPVKSLPQLTPWADFTAGIRGARQPEPSPRGQACAARSARMSFENRQAAGAAALLSVRALTFRASGNHAFMTSDERLLC